MEGAAPARGDDAAPVQRAQMTVAQALALPELRAGLPDVLAGASRLGRAIRWAHAGEVPNIASLLSGGELLLSTGMGIGTGRGEQRKFVSELAKRDVAALVVELGASLPALPPALVEAAEEHELPLVALHREVPFVAVTEAIHTEIVNRRYALLRRAQTLSHRLSMALLDGGGVAEVLDALCDALGNPVFLEDSFGGLIHHVIPEREDAGLALDAWEAAHTRQGRQARGVRVERAVALGGRGAASGRLLVLPASTPLHELAEVVADHAAEALALALLRAREEQELRTQSRGNLLSAMLAGRIAGGQARREARLAGFDAVGTLLPAAVEMVAERNTGPIAVPTAESLVAPEESRGVLREIQAELAGIGLPALLGQGARPGTLLVLISLGGDRQGGEEQRGRPVDRGDSRQGGGASAHGRVESLADAIHGSVARRLGTAARAVIAVARPASWETAGGGLALAAEAAASAGTLPHARWHDVEALELQRLLWRWRQDPALAEFAQRALGPLIEHDRVRRRGLLPTLEALCAIGGRRAQAARALQLNRQALYARLARIEQLLDVDLGDPETLLRLHLALRALRLLDATARRPPGIDT